MKKISILLSVIALLMLVSCGGNAKDDVKVEETIRNTEKAEETEKVTETDAVISEEVKEAFATNDVFTYNFMTVGEVKKRSAESDDFGEFYSSKPSVATVDSEGTVTAHSAGVVLIAREIPGNDFVVSAICVFPEGEGPDRSAGESANVFEVGETFMHTAPVGGVEYSSSNENVVDVSNAPNLSFKETGYACVTCASASRPFFYNFIVYDRVVE